MITQPSTGDIAGGFGFDAFRVSTDEEFRPALEKAVRSEKPALVVVTDLEIITPDKTLTEIRKAAG